MADGSCPFRMCVIWSGDHIGVMSGLGAGAAAVQTPQMKSQIELFVGNIPVGTTQQGLVDFLNAAMLKVNIQESRGKNTMCGEKPVMFRPSFLCLLSFIFYVTS